MNVRTYIILYVAAGWDKSYNYIVERWEMWGLEENYIIIYNNTNFMSHSMFMSQSRSAVSSKSEVIVNLILGASANTTNNWLGCLHAVAGHVQLLLLVAWSISHPTIYMYRVYNCAWKCYVYIIGNNTNYIVCIPLLYSNIVTITVQ